MTYFQLYLLTVLPNIGTFFIIVGVLLLILCLAIAWGILDSGNAPEKEQKIVALIGVFLLFIGTLVPTKADLAFIVGGKYLTNSEWSKLPDTTAKWLNKTLEQYLNEEKK